MKLTCIKIKNFRSFKDEKTINLEKGLTTLAGPNNSGKTATVELLDIILTNKKFNISDINMLAYSKLRDLQRKVNRQEHDVDTIDSEIGTNNSSICLEVSFEDDSKIALFAPYICDLGDEKKIYFMIKNNMNSLKDLKNLEENIMNFQIFYCNKEYITMGPIDAVIFKKLFNYHYIVANRKLDDNARDKSRKLSRKAISLAKGNQEWEDIVKELSESITTRLSEKNIKDLLENLVANTINEEQKSFAKVNGGNTGNIGMSLMLGEKNILELLEEVFSLGFFDEESNFFSEKSQGLGYSNLLDLIFEVIYFEKKIEPTLINLLAIEEPEAHLHPHMERIFTKFISDKNNFQTVITTHGLDIIKKQDIKNIRVVRKVNQKTEVFDLSNYIGELEEEDSKRIIKFFPIVLSDAIFADNIILFEGDAERLILNFVIDNDDRFANLSEKYTSYIQVGGAHAIKFKGFTDFLKIKTLSISDIDYSKEPDNNDTSIGNVDEYAEIRSTTNPTIRSEILENLHTSNVIELYAKVEAYMENRINQKMFYVTTQCKRDGYARTLEEAILFKFKTNLEISDDVFSKITKEKWNEIHNEKKFEGIPTTSKQETTIRNRVANISCKTTFAYWFIENYEQDILPEYIVEGLEWLGGTSEQN